MKNLLRTIGPGILFASTAIGVSHLVQSTQAGAYFGFNMLWAVILANLFKYPFFEFGARYANATGESLISGYRKLGLFPLWSFFAITLVSMFLVTAAVGSVTAGFMQNLFQLESTTFTLLLLFSICVIILVFNNFKVLDGLIKIIGIVLLLSTLIAFFMVLFKGPQGNRPLMGMDSIPSEAYLGFLIPLIGWMPTALDLSAWSSLWTIERIKQTGYHPTLKETKFDFNLGYLISSLLAICFITLGAFIMYGTHLSFSMSPAQFSNEVIQLYSTTFGHWATPIMAISAFSIMFGTCIAVFDGYSRAMAATLPLLTKKQKDTTTSRTTYRWLLLLIALGSFSIIYTFQNDPAGFKKLINLATSVSFVLAPVIAIYNLILMQSKYVGELHVPNLLMRLLAYAGLLFLLLFSIYYLVFL